MTQTALDQQIESEDSAFIPSFSIKKLGKVLLGDHQNLPDNPGIYFAIDSASRIWYIGISTSSLRKRHSQHEKFEDFKTNKVQSLIQKFLLLTKKIVFEKVNVHSLIPKFPLRTKKSIFKK